MMGYCKIRCRELFYKCGVFVISFGEGLNKFNLDTEGPIRQDRKGAMKDLNRVLGGYGTTIFTVMSALATQHKAINLGQGFPDSSGPDSLIRVAATALLEGNNQYPPMMGVAALRQAVAAQNKRFYGLDIDWEKEVIVTSGATEAIADCLFAVVNPGDEVIVIEPLYDSYLPIAEQAGAVIKTIRLTPPNWALDEKMLADAFSSKTKAILVNSPMNPTGKVFSKTELALIARYVEKYDAYAICDEVYEHLTFDNHGHHPLLGFPGMRDRCMRIGSAGKSFSVTGWKIGYITAAAPLMARIARAHQFITFTSAPHLQIAVAWGLTQGREYFETLRSDLGHKRDMLQTGLADIGFKPLDSAGTYFVTADFSAFADGRDDSEFCHFLTTEIGVAAVPVSAFYAPAYAKADVEPVPKNLIRFCFCKKEPLLQTALERLRRL